MIRFEGKLRWPSDWKRSKTRTDSRYRVGHTQALEDLEIELERLGGSNIIITLNGRVRNDGRPYAEVLRRKQVDDPGVAVYFHYLGGTRVIACDQWLAPWENVRAVGLSIAALRQLERAGASEVLVRAYDGFKQLTGPGAPRTWHDVLEVSPGATKDVIRDAYRRLARQYHPDRPGGSDALMAELSRARDLGLETAT